MHTIFLKKWNSVEKTNKADGGRRIDRATVHAAHDDGRFRRQARPGTTCQAAPRSTHALPKWQQRTVFGLLSNGFHPWEETNFFFSLEELKPTKLDQQNGPSSILGSGLNWIFSLFKSEDRMNRLRFPLLIYLPRFLRPIIWGVHGQSPIPSICRCSSATAPSKGCRHRSYVE